MIGKIKGVLTEINEGLSLIETKGGLFYEVHLTPHLLTKYHVGDDVEIYTHLQVKEDKWQLYGFATKEEKRYFYLLTTVSGVGPKIAFAIISFFKNDGLVKAIRENNFSSLAQVPGLGKKTAMKIILELSQKIDKKALLGSVFLSQENQTVVDALKSLGFQEYQIISVVNQLPASFTVEEKIKKALTEIKG